MNPKDAYQNLFSNGRAYVEQIPIELIEDFYLEEYGEHPFKVKDDEKLQELADEIKEYGVYTPAIVRQHPTDRDKFQMISGHRRKAASMKAGLTTIPCTIKQLTDEEAVQIMVSSNLQSRETILPSEKAFAYKMQYEAMKRSKGRTAKIGEPSSPIPRTAEIIAKENGTSDKTIKNYIRLTYLIPEMLELVDNRTVAMKQAVEISYIDEEHQKYICSAIEDLGASPDLTQALEFKRLFAEGNLDEDTVYDVLGKEKGNQKEMYQLPYDTILKNFQTKERKIINATINQALGLFPELMKDENADLRIALAESTASDNALTILAKDKEAEVREAVAKNPACPADVKKLLAQDKNEAVRRAAQNKVKNKDNR